MIAGLLAPSRGQLPLGRDAAGGFLTCICALCVLVAGLSGAGLIMFGDALAAAEDALGAALTVEIPAEASTARLQTVLALLRQTPGIAAARPLEPAETAQLLEPWLGGAVNLGELPVPRLIDLRADSGAALDLAGLRQKIAQIAPGAQITDHRPDLPGMRAAARPVEWLLAAGFAGPLALIAVASAFTVRAGLVADRGIIELLHLLGAADGAIVTRVALRPLRFGLLGGGIGAVAAALALLAMRGAGRVIRLPAPIEAVGIADWRFWLMMAGLVVGAGLVAMAGARLAAARRLAQMP
jgi:cell division transport system permease protein